MCHSMVGWKIIKNQNEKGKGGEEGTSIIGK